MQTKVRKWGNSLGGRIPHGLAATVGVTEDTAVELLVEGDTIIIKPIHIKPSLKDLVEKITPENRHDETDWGGFYGKETY